MMLGEMRLQQRERLLWRVRSLDQIDVPRADRSPVGHRLETEDRIPVLGPVEDDLDLLRQLLGLHQRQDLEHLVERAEAARKDHERLGEIRKPELAHEEVVELEVQSLGDVAIRALLERKPDVQADRLAAGIGSAAIGRFHDPGTAA